MEHLSFSTFQYGEFKLSGIYCKSTNRLYNCKGLVKNAYKRLLKGKITFEEIGGTYLSIDDECKYLGECLDLKLKYNA